MRFAGISAGATGKLITALLICATLSTSASANPKGSDPYRPLAAHGTIEEAKAMVADLYELYQEEVQFVIESQKFRDNPTRLSDRGISKASSRIWKARRDANHLTLMGEAAGSDLTKKFSTLLREVYRLADAYRATPRGVQLVQRYRTERTRKAPAVRKLLQQAAAAIERGQLDAVEKQLEKTGMELKSQIVFFSRPEANRFFQELAAVLARNDELLRSQRRRQYTQRAGEVISAEVVAATEFAAEARRIADELAAGGSAELDDGTTGNASEALAHLVKLWGHASAGLLRATTIQWAFTGSTESQVQPNPAELKATALQALAAVVEAAATSTPPQDVQATYTRLLKQISVADRRLGPGSTSLSEACQPALSKLAAKDPALQRRIEAYERATSEVLRWRREFAAQQAKHLAETYPDATSLMTEQGPVADSNRPNYIVSRQRETVTAPPSFSGPVDWMVRDAASRLVGQLVTEQQLLHLTPAARVAVVPVRSNHYANVPIPLPSEAEQQDLLRSLIVDDEHGPLSVATADAVSSAELQDYLVVAGQIEEVHLESMVSRFAALPDVAYTLAPLGSLPPVDSSIAPLQQALWRFDLSPRWARQRYFTTRVPASAP